MFSVHFKRFFFEIKNSIYDFTALSTQFLFNNQVDKIVFRWTFVCVHVFPFVISQGLFTPGFCKSNCFHETSLLGT